MHREEVMNPANCPCNKNQTCQDNEKPFYYLYQLDFFLFFLNFFFQFLVSLLNFVIKLLLKKMNS